MFTFDKTKKNFMLTDTIKLIIFDLAGTTVYDDEFVTTALCNSLADFGFKIPLSAGNEMMGISKPVAIKKLIEQYYPDQMDLVDITPIHEKFLALMIDFYKNNSEIREIEGTTEIFTLLKNAGVKIGIDTGFSRDITNIILNRMGWEQKRLIDVSVTSDEVENGRPAPDMIFKAMNILGIEQSEDVAKVGDTPVDMLEGINANCGLTIGVLTGVGKREVLSQFSNVTLLSSVKAIPAIILQNVVNS